MTRVSRHPARARAGGQNQNEGHTARVGWRTRGAPVGGGMHQAPRGKSSGFQAPSEQPSPEEQELRFKRVELRRLHLYAAHLESSLETMRTQLEAFAFRRVFRLGRTYRRIDQLELRTTELVLARDPGNPVLHRRVQEARAQLRRSQEAPCDAEEPCPPVAKSIPPDLKALCREAAQRFEQTLAESDADGQLTHAFMVRLTAACGRRDIDAIRGLIATWEAQHGSHAAISSAEQLRLVLGAIGHSRNSIARLEFELFQLRSRPDHKLMVRANWAELEGLDLLAEMEATLAARIAALEAGLRGLGGEAVA